MKRLSKTIKMAVALALIFAVSACNDKEEETSGNDDFPKAVEFTTIGRCSLSETGGERISKENLAITSTSEWEAFKTKIGDAHSCPVNDFLTMEIDFSAYQVIAIIEDVKPHGGYSIDITAITEDVDHIVVDVVTRSSVPAPDIEIQPFCLALMPASEKKIVFEHTENDFPKTIEFTTIGECYMSTGAGSFPKENFVVTSSSEWEALKTKIGDAHFCPVNDFLTMEIDFSAYQLIAAIEEVKGGGWSIHITTITEYVDEIVVEIITRHPIHGTTEDNQPFHLALMPASNKEIVFEHTEAEFPQEITFTTIGKCSMHGSGSEGFSKENFVITSSSEWEALKEKIGNPHDCDTNDFLTAAVDFSLYQVLAIFDEIRGDNGWFFYIVDIIEYEENIVVDIASFHSNYFNTVVTQPFQIVTMPISDKEIVFVQNE